MDGFDSENTQNPGSPRAETKKRDLSRGDREKYPDKNPVLSPFWKLPQIVSLFLRLCIKQNIITITLSLSVFLGNGLSLDFISWTSNRMVSLFPGRPFYLILAELHLL